MINPNELKIGNYVLRKTSGGVAVGNCRDLPFFQIKFGHQIDNIEKPGVYNGELRNHPIPLTEEWLVKLGFVKGKDLHNEYFYKEKVPFASTKGEQTLRLYIDKDGGYYGEFYGVIIKYLHQLQNFYFTIGGTELEIK